MSARRHRGFTLVEVLVALLIVALGLAALMTTISGAADQSGYLRDKTIAQWIAMNRLVEVRLNLQKFGQNNDKAELKMGGRDWHYDTRYYDTSISSMRRVVVRVWAGKTDTKGNPLAEAIGFTGADLTVPGGSNVDWTQGSIPASSGAAPAGVPGGASAAQAPVAQPVQPP
ncbi:MAG: type II secretion system minor pseudopilin GspI [Gammaproteobacteria bacterium]|nr:type II secretion system minor pseudopilin GspI [Gammaproteobacteria bacterium]MDE2348787.1 type II secretion system minor pseudopilin GspI [Gammaproteobacteria bacterium]